MQDQSLCRNGFIPAQGWRLLTFQAIPEAQEKLISLQSLLPLQSRTVPKLPPIHRPPQKKAFVFPTTSDLKLQHRQQDDAVVEHSPSNPQCSCELCRMNASIGALGTGYTGLTAPTGLSGYREEMDSRETMLTQQVAIGQRVLVRMKKSEFDLEPQKLTGIVRYVGKIDSEFVDNRIYVGLKLDEAGDPQYCTLYTTFRTYYNSVSRPSIIFSFCSWRHRRADKG